MRLATTTIAAAMVLATLGCERSQDRSGFTSIIFSHPRLGEHAYSVFEPTPPIPRVPLPLVVFLHGSGEIGSDGWKHVKVGLGPYCYGALSDKSAPRFYALFPQARDAADWSIGSDEGDLVFEYIEEVCHRLPVDRARIYLTGQSAGAAGVWQLAVRRPDLWAALVVVTGKGDPAIAARIASLPTWVFHGSCDDPSSVRNARAMVAALRGAGGSPKYTEIVGGTHIVWPAVFSRPALYEWLLAQKRTDTTTRWNLDHAAWQIERATP